MDGSSLIVGRTCEPRHFGDSHVLRADSNTDELRPHSAQDGCTLQQTHGPRESSRAGIIQASADLVPDRRQHPLSETGGKLTAALDLARSRVHRTFAKRCSQQIGPPPLRLERQD